MGDVAIDVGEVGRLFCLVCCMFVVFIVLSVVILAIYAIYSHIFVFTAPWDHLDVVVRLDSLRGDQRSLLLWRNTQCLRCLLFFFCSFCPFLCLFCPTYSII